MPLVSVIMATHRPTPFLVAAIESVLGQSHLELELILVDNGAGLDSAALGAAKIDPRVRLVQLPENRGIPAAHNFAVALARGDFIALLDHDDLMRPRRLERQVAALVADPGLGLVSSLAETIDAAGQVTGREFALVSSADQQRYSLYSTPVVTPAYTGRRAVFADLPYREAFSLTADFDFLARAAERVRLGAVPEVLLHYRRHATQATRVHAAEIEWQRAWVRLAAARRRAGRPEALVLLPAGPADAAEAALQAADLARAEGFSVLAAFQARRAASLRRSPGFVGRAAAKGLAGVLAAGAERSQAAAMLCRGPVRALGVQPG